MAILGELEQAIMEILWEQRKPLSVRAVHESLLNQRDLAYTTVMTVLDRLAKKHLVRRERDGRAWLYVAGPSRGELVGSSLADVFGQAGADRGEALQVFVAGLDEGGRALLDEALRG